MYFIAKARKTDKETIAKNNKNISLCGYSQDFFNTIPDS